MKTKAPVILSMLATLILTASAEANQAKMQPAETVTHSDREFSRGIGQLVVGGLTLYLLIQVSNRK